MTDAELVRAVAIEVMGWVIIEDRQIEYPIRVGNGKEELFELKCEPEYYDEKGPVYSEKHWNPLTNANHRDMVVEAMREKGWECMESNEPSFSSIMEGSFLAKFVNRFDEIFTCLGKTRGRAVCLAALEAVRGSP
jgi:hypothetical protein